MKKIIVLNSAFAQALGVMFRPRLGENIFVFIYPSKARRLFQTFFCPSMRMVALEKMGEQQAKNVFEKVVPPWRFVSLPAADLIVEMAPEMQMDKDLVAEILLAVGDHKHIAQGGVDANTGVQDLILRFSQQQLPTYDGFVRFVGLVVMGV